MISLLVLACISALCDGTDPGPLQEHTRLTAGEDGDQRPIQIARPDGKGGLEVF
jgi:hypothetical protein